MKMLLVLVVLIVCGLVYWALGKQFPQLRRQSTILWVVGLIGVGALLFFSIDGSVGAMLADRVSEGFAKNLGTHPFVTSAIYYFIFGGILLLWWIFVQKQKSFNWFLVVVMGIGPFIYYSSLYIFTKNFLFNPTSGDANKCYVVTKEGVTYFDFDPQNQRFDPKTGKTCQPITAALADKLATLDARIKSNVPVAPIDPQKVDWFSPATGEPLLWYGDGSDGVTQFFDLPGFHPKTGLLLDPVTTQVQLTWTQQQNERVAIKSVETQQSDNLVRSEMLRKKYGADVVASGGSMVIIHSESVSGESAELAQLLRQKGFSGTIPAPTSSAEEAITTAVLAGNVSDLLDSGLLGRVGRIRVLNVSASCRNGDSLAGVVVCSGAFDERITTSNSTTVSQNKHNAETPGVSKQDALEQLSNQLRKSI